MMFKMKSEIEQGGSMTVVEELDAASNRTVKYRFAGGGTTSGIFMIDADSGRISTVAGAVFGAAFTPWASWFMIRNIPTCTTRRPSACRFTLPKFRPVSPVPRRVRPARPERTRALVEPVSIHWKRGSGIDSPRSAF